jgi:hypothetical protein
MTRIDDYRHQLRYLDDWLPFLQASSNLPGPRANLELAHAVAQEADPGRIDPLLSLESASPNTPDEFVFFCGVLALGPRLAAGQMDPLPTLRRLAPDPRWRIREAVATALQYWGDADMPALLAETATWAQGNRGEQRAAVAALCEPRLLHNPDHTGRVLALLDQVTASLVAAPDRAAEPFRFLRQALGYCWSVAIVACPDLGRPLFERWHAHPDPDIRWLVRENLKKSRLAHLEPAWVARLQAALARPA